MYHAFILSPDSPARRANVEQQCTKIGISVPHIFPAIMGRNFSDSELQRLVSSPTYLSKGEIGCVLSHLGVYEEFLQDTSAGYAAVFEDDAVFEPELSLALLDQIGSFVASLDEPALIVLQKSRYHKTVVKDFGVTKVYGAHNLFYAYGYVLNRQAAKNIREVQTPVRFEMDAFKYYWWLDKCSLYCLNKNLVTVMDSPSVIGQDRFDGEDRDKIKRQCFNELYRSLPLSGKITVVRRRLMKALNKLFETENY